MGKQSPQVLMIMLCHRCALGGAEKRYARLFEMLTSLTDGEHKLVINRAMLTLLNSAGILTDHASTIVVLDPPSSRFPLLKRVRLMNLAVDSLWYMWRCFCTILKYPSATTHPLLTAVHYCLPTFLLMPNRRLLMSAYSYQFENYRDRAILGIPVAATIKRLMMRRAGRIDALSESIRTDLIERGIGDHKIDVAPNTFTDLSLCHIAEDKEKWITFVGRLEALKNPMLLAEAIPMVIRRHPDAHFHFVGSGGDEAQLRGYIDELGLGRSVSIYFDSSPTNTLARSSIFVSLQGEENYPSQSLLEAMACGNVIVATDVGETWRLVDESNGLRVQPNAEKVAAAIVWLLDSPDLAEMQQASRERILKTHTAEKFFSYIMDVYDYTEPS